ncbi:MAG: thioredoxin family protein [Capsulimonadaceae bacterium]
MSYLTANQSGVIASCPVCGRSNRIPFERLNTVGQCGACKAEIRIETPIDVEGEAAFDALVGRSPVPVLVDYWAPWCPPCRAVAPELEKVACAAAGSYIVAKVDTQAQPGLGVRSRVSGIPTMVLFQGGQEAGRAVGARPAAAIEAFVRQSVRHAPDSAPAPGHA